MEEKKTDLENNSLFNDALIGFYKEYDTESLSSAAKKFQDLIIDTLKHSDFSKVKVFSRIKTQESCREKFERKYRKKWEEDGSKLPISNYITDKIGLRVVCLYDDEIRLIADLLKDAFKCDIDGGETDKTSVTKSDESKFGYLGIHLDLKLGPKLSETPSHAHLAEIPFEVQIRSISQDAWSEVDHGLKYKKESLPKDIKRRVNRLAALFELADQEFIAIRNSIESAEKNIETTTFDESTTLLDVITLGYLVKSIFDDEPLSKFHSTSILEEVNNFDSTMTVSEFRKIIEDNLPQVKKYISTFNGTDWKTATIIRYCLYTQSSVDFGDLLQNFQVKKYDPWRIKNLTF